MPYWLDCVGDWIKDCWAAGSEGVLAVLALGLVAVLTLLLVLGLGGYLIDAYHVPAHPSVATVLDKTQIPASVKTRLHGDGGDTAWAQVTVSPEETRLKLQLADGRETETLVSLAIGSAVKPGQRVAIMVKDGRVTGRAYVTQVFVEDQ